MSKYQLGIEIIKLSEAATWDEAKREWALEDVHWEDEPDTCLCGHFPIKEICLLRNRLNGKGAIVGNCCVKKFSGLPSDLIFQAVKRVTKDESKGLNFETLLHAKEKNWINDWEFDFYSRTRSKRSLSGKQRAKRIEINQKVLGKVKNSRGR